ncbi:hypothetical protein GCM10019016_065550 [Streptomyces prasinosporus]|uniref:Uncharacterized protein n=1 Tax=Streptomyces prasinosporus TaxID=68256 RepID=A0ABP6TZF2_9ACTN
MDPGRILRDPGVAEVSVRGCATGVRGDTGARRAPGRGCCPVGVADGHTAPQWSGADPLARRRRTARCHAPCRTIGRPGRRIRVRLRAADVDFGTPEGAAGLTPA